MEDVEPWSDRQLAVMRSILLLWHELSRGDIQIICGCVHTPLAMVLTVRNTAHARFWHHLVEIGWADQHYSPIDPHDYDHEPLAFRLRPGAERPLSHFLVFYDLLNMGACTPANDAQTSRAESLERDRDTTRSFVDARFILRAWGLFATLLVGIAIGRVIAG